MSDFLQPHELQHARLPCLSQSPWICSNSCPLSRWCHLTISSFVALFFCLQSFLGSVSFPTESARSIRWPKYWSFSISPSNKYSGLMSFWIDWFVLLAVQRTLKSLLQHNSKASILQCLSLQGFPGGSAACNVEDLGSIPELGSSPGEGNSYPPQYSGLKNPMDCHKESMESQRVGRDWATFTFSLHYDPSLISIHDYWENHGFDYTNLCQQSNVFAF